MDDIERHEKDYMRDPNTGPGFMERVAAQIGGVLGDDAGTAENESVRQNSDATTPDLPDVQRGQQGPDREAQTDAENPPSGEDRKIH